MQWHLNICRKNLSTWRIIQLICLLKMFKSLFWVVNGVVHHLHQLKDLLKVCDKLFSSSGSNIASHECIIDNLAINAPPIRWHLEWTYGEFETFLYIKAHLLLFNLSMCLHMSSHCYWQTSYKMLHWHQPIGYKIKIMRNKWQRKARSKVFF